MQMRLFLVAWAITFVTRVALGNDTPSASSNATELAQRRFHEATQAYQEGRYSAAASLFEAADRLAPHVSSRFNAATAWDNAGEAARAATGYAAVLEFEGLDEARRRDARQRLSDLEPGLGRVHIGEPLGALVSVDHIQRVPVPLSFYLRPGSYELAAEYRGTRSTTPMRVTAGEAQTLKLRLPPRAGSATIPPSSPPPRLPPPLPPQNASGTRETWGWIAVGTGVASSCAAIVLGLRFLSAKSRYDASGFTDAEARAEASDLRLATNVAWGGATVAGAAGLVLLLTAPTVKF